jgi:hypothetical protein
MKPHLVAIFTFLIFPYGVPGQAPIEFRSIIDSAHALPPTSGFTPSTGLFYLYPDIHFQASVGIPWSYEAETVTIYTSSTAAQLGTPIGNLTFTGSVFPLPEEGEFGHDVYEFGKALTQSEIDDLVAGRWWVNVTAQGFPTGIVRGQILAVPEPAITYLTLPALGILWMSVRRWNTQNKGSSTFSVGEKTGA